MCECKAVPVYGQQRSRVAVGQARVPAKAWRSRDARALSAAHPPRPRPVTAGVHLPLVDHRTCDRPLRLHPLAGQRAMVMGVRTAALIPEGRPSAAAHVMLRAYAWASAAPTVWRTPRLCRSELHRRPLSAEPSCSTSSIVLAHQ